MAYYLAIIPPAVYESLSKSDRTICGFREQWKKIAGEIHAGDKLVCYMKHFFRWIGVLEVDGDYFTDNTPIFFEKTDPLTVRFKVRPLVWLSKEQCIPKNEKSIQDKLSLTIANDKKFPALSRIEEKDGLFLEAILNEQIHKKEIYTIDERKYQKLVTERTKRQSVFFRMRRGIIYSNFFLNVLTGLIVFFIRLYNKTLKTRTEYPPEFSKLDPTKAIYALWHAKDFLLLSNFGKWKVCIMVDDSWAGEFIARILEKLGFATARGSSKRKGAHALREMKKVMEQGYAGAVVVDGPTGPVYKSKPGVLLLSRMTGCPIVPCTTTANRAWIFKNTWCKYMIPKPFARCFITAANPLWKSTKKGAMTSKDLDKKMMDLMIDADKKMGLTD
ncbi:DUF374 domain-containing protein [Verrucomicrobiota bacterium]